MRIKKVYTRARALTTIGAVSETAVLNITEDCVLAWIDISGGLMAEGAPGAVSGFVTVGRNNLAGLEDSDNGVLIASASAQIRSDSAAATTDNGVSWNKFCSVMLPLKRGETLRVQVSCVAGSRAMGVLVFGFHA